MPSKATSGEEQEESEEIYSYILCAVCPVELAKPALGYREDENRIGARVRDWVVGLPDLGFVYPAFSGRGSDVNAVMYYVKTGKSSHPEFIENVLGCVSQRTAAEDKQAFESVVKNAFGEDELFYQFSRTGFTEENPFASKILHNFAMKNDQMADLQYVMNSEEHYGGEDPEAAVTEWAEDNPEFFEDWAAGTLTDQFA